MMMLRMVAALAALLITHTAALTLLTPATLWPAQQAHNNRNVLCQCWRTEKLRKERVEPAVAHYLPPNMGPTAAYTELNRICGTSQAPPDDVRALQELYNWVERNIGPALYKNPLDAQYFKVQAKEILAELPENSRNSVQILDYGCGSGEALMAIRELTGLSREALHCIEVYDFGKHDDFVLHVLKDPVVDLNSLSTTKLAAQFDVISAFSVFHHIPNKTVRAAAFSGIVSMLKPGGIFLLSDWNDEGSSLLAHWFDIAHWLSWLFAGLSGPPSNEVSVTLATHYSSFGGYKAELTSRGLKLQEDASSGTKHTVSPVGGFRARFQRAHHESESAKSELGLLLPTAQNRSLLRHAVLAQVH